MPNHAATSAIIASLSLAGCAGAPTGRAAPTVRERAVIDAVESLFTAMRERDAEAMERVLAPEVFITVVDADRGGSARLAMRDEVVQGFLAAPGALDERMWRPEVRIDGALATLWAPYSFRVDGAMSHCGHDAVQLVQRDGRWVIVAIAYTRMREGCEAFEPPSVAARAAARQ